MRHVLMMSREERGLMHREGRCADDATRGQVCCSCAEMTEALMMRKKDRCADNVLRGQMC